AKDDGPVALVSESADGQPVVEGAQDEDALQVSARQRWHGRLRAGGEDEKIVWLDHLAAAADNEALFAVNLFGLDAGVNKDAAFLEPLGRPQLELLGIIEAVEHARQQDAIGQR